MGTRGGSVDSGGDCGVLECGARLWLRSALSITLDLSVGLGSVGRLRGWSRREGSCLGVVLVARELCKREGGFLLIGPIRWRMFTLRRCCFMSWLKKCESVVLVAFIGLVFS